MARKKKKILFDVIGSSGSSRRQRGLLGVGRGGRGKGAGLADGELKVSTPLAGALGAAVVVFMVLAYYFGTRQGEDGTPAADAGGGTATLQRSVASGGGEMAYTILATSKSYTRYTRQDQEAELRELGASLKRAGFPDVSLRDYADADGTGVLKLWVGAAATQQALEEAAQRLRAFQDERGEQPCVNAWIRDLSNRK